MIELLLAWYIAANSAYSLDAGVCLLGGGPRRLEAIQEHLRDGSVGRVLMVGTREELEDARSVLGNSRRLDWMEAESTREGLQVAGAWAQEHHYRELLLCVEPEYWPRVALAQWLGFGGGVVRFPEMVY